MSSASDFIVEKSVLKKYVGPGGDVVIPEGVTSIGKEAFRGCDAIISIAIPNGVTSIGARAFELCNNLAKVTIPRSIKSIGAAAFFGCDALMGLTISDLAAWCDIDFSQQQNPFRGASKHSLYLNDMPVQDLDIPRGVTTIKDYAFFGCDSLTRVSFLDSVTTIGAEAFGNCNNLMYVTIPESVTSVGGCAFINCSKAEFVISDEAANRPEYFKIEKGTLRKYYGPGGHVVIPQGVTNIGKAAFYKCSSLTTITIPEGVIGIGYGAFDKCSALTSVTIPEGVKSIGGYAFNGCTKLTEVKIPQSLKSIGERAFSGCRCLAVVNIPDSTAEVDPDFLDADGVTGIVISNPSRLPASLRPKAAVGFSRNHLNGVESGFKENCKYIKSNAAKLVDVAITHPDLLALMCQERLIASKDMQIYMEAVQKTGKADLIAIMLDYNDNKIGAKQKEDVEKRKEKEQAAVTDRMLTRQGKQGIEGLNIAVTGNLETFGNRNELKAFILEKGGKLASSLTAKVDYLIMNYPETDSAKKQAAQELGIEVITERKFNELAGRLFTIEGTRLIKYCGNSEKVTVPNGVTSIGFFAFQGCTGLTSLSITGDVTSIDTFALSDLPNLTIHAPAGSYAEQYAKENNIPFVAE